MIVASAPLRFSLNGGGSDLPKFTLSGTGCTVGAPLNRRVYITANPSFDGNYRIAYSKIEKCALIDEISHPLVRGTLKELNWAGPGLEITSIAEIPSSGTGLGSSSAFTIALLLAVSTLQGRNLTSDKLAELACNVEIRRLGAPIGLQDQYMIASGSLKRFDFLPNQIVRHENVFKNSALESIFIEKFNRKLLFFHFDNNRSANQILETQGNAIVEDSTKFELTQQLANLAITTTRAIKEMDFRKIGQLMTAGWRLKSSLNGDSKSPEISEVISWLENNSHIVHGGKMLGAGGGGFLSIVADEKYHELITENFSRYKRVDMSLECAFPKVERF
jgi:D-glycero-alpha-D-manno-heptose-7-phosphate kinase